MLVLDRGLWLLMGGCVKVSCLRSRDEKRHRKYPVKVLVCVGHIVPVIIFVADCQFVVPSTQKYSVGRRYSEQNSGKSHIVGLITEFSVQLCIRMTASHT